MACRRSGSDLPPSESSSIAARATASMVTSRGVTTAQRLGVILDPIGTKGSMLYGIIHLERRNWRYEMPVWVPVLVSRAMSSSSGVVTLQLLHGKVQVNPSVGEDGAVAQMVAISLVMLQLNFFTKIVTFGKWRRNGLSFGISQVLWRDFSPRFRFRLHP